MISYAGSGTTGRRLVATQTARDRSSKVLPPTTPDQSLLVHSAVVISAGTSNPVSTSPCGNVDFHRDIPDAISRKKVEDEDDSVFVKGSIRRFVACERPTEVRPLQIAVTLLRTPT
jgi:hypothetical protein